MWECGRGSFKPWIDSDGNHAPIFLESHFTFFGGVWEPNDHS